MKISERSLRALDGVHPDLVRVVKRAHDLGGAFIVTEGLRTPERQKQLVKQGLSRTLKSRHLTGHAVDLCDTAATYNPAAMIEIGRVMKQASALENVPIEWGGDWKQKPTDRIGWDGPHFQLPVDYHPAPVPEIKGVAEPVVTVQVPKPAIRSRTLGNIVVGGSLLTWLGSLVAEVLTVVTSAAAQFAAMAPSRDFLAMLGGNGKVIATAVGVGCLVSAVCAKLDDRNKQGGTTKQVEP